MNNKEAFFQYLIKKRKKQTYIDSCGDLIDKLYDILKDKPPTSEIIDMFVKKRWSGYVSRDRTTYQILNDYSDFCETELPLFSIAFREHIRETFEGEARKAMKAYKNAIAPIPKDTKIESFFLDGLTNNKYVETFKSLQELIYAIYDAIEHGSPFDWGWPNWNAITAEGINQNRVMTVLNALVCSGYTDHNTLVVDKKRFGRYNICKPIANTKLMLKRFIDMGFYIEEYDNKNLPNFTVSYPNNANLITVLCSYFKNRRSDCRDCGEGCDGDSCYKYYCGKHIRLFSYRFVEDPAKQTREKFFLAKTDGEPEQLREIYYWLYDEAVKHGFSPKGYENMGCYSYKKGTKEWLLLGNGSSYHEDEFLHSPNYILAAKVRYLRVFKTHPEIIDDLMKRFPDSFGRPWTQCFRCKEKADDCNKRVSFKKGSQDYHHCGKHHYLYFHDPDFNDLKVIYELYKIENDIK